MSIYFLQDYHTYVQHIPLDSLPLQNGTFNETDKSIELVSIYVKIRGLRRIEVKKKSNFVAFKFQKKDQGNLMVPLFLSVVTLSVQSVLLQGS